MKSQVVPIVLILALVSACAGVHRTETAEPTGQDAPGRLCGLPLLYEEDFEDGTAEGWLPSDSDTWKVEKDGDRWAFALQKDCDYKPPVRSPVNLAILEDLTVSDFVLEARLRSTTADYGHRDMCLFFNHQDPTHFYYVHMGLNADPHSNSIFLVNGEPRVSIARLRTPGTRWSEDYHTVRVVRDTETGSIEVFFDDMEDPIMKAIDTNFTWGRIGVGSFDDTGNIDYVRVWGRKKRPPKPTAVFENTR